MFQTDYRKVPFSFKKPSSSHGLRAAQEDSSGYYKIRPLPASFVSLPRLHSMNRERDSHLLKEALTIRFLNGSSMDVVLRLIHDCIGALHKRHRKEKEKLNP